MASALLLLALLHFGNSAYKIRWQGFADLPIFLFHAKSFIDTGQLYRPSDDLTAYDAGTQVYKWPPLGAILLLPSVADGIPVVEGWTYTYHWAFQILAYALSVGLGIYMLRPRDWKPFTFVALLAALVFSPFFETLFGLQLETPILLMLTLCVLFLHKKQDVLAGVMIGICGVLKVYPAFLILFLVVKLRWKAVAACVATAAVLLVVGLVVIGPEENKLYFFKILPYMLKETPSPDHENLAIGRYAQEWLRVERGTSKTIGQLLAVPLLGLSLIAIYRNRGRAVLPAMLAVEFSLLIGSNLLILPNSWQNYQLLLLLPVLALIALSMSDGRVRVPTLVLTLVASVLLFFSETYADVGYYPVPRSMLYSLSNIRILATVVLWALSLVWVLRSSRDSRASEVVRAIP